MCDSCSYNTLDSNVLIKHELIACVLPTCDYQSAVQEEVRLPWRDLLEAPLDVAGVQAFTIFRRQLFVFIRPCKD